MVKIFFDCLVDFEDIRCGQFFTFFGADNLLYFKPYFYNRIHESCPVAVCIQTGALIWSFPAGTKVSRVDVEIKVS